MTHRTVFDVFKTKQNNCLGSTLKRAVQFPKYSTFFTEIIFTTVQLVLITELKLCTLNKNVMGYPNCKPELFCKLHGFIEPTNFVPYILTHSYNYFPHGLDKMQKVCSPVLENTQGIPRSLTPVNPNPVGSKNINTCKRINPFFSV